MANAAPPRTLLYVEDDRINVILMEEALRRHPSWTMRVAEDGADALRQLAALAEAGALPDLVLIDIHLPDIGGIELLGRIRADARLQGLRFVAMSADDPAPTVRAALAAGFSAFWLKPVDVKRLLEMKEPGGRPGS